MTTKRRPRGGRPRRRSFAPSTTWLEPRLTLSVAAVPGTVELRHHVPRHSAQVRIVREVVYRDVPGDRQVLDLLLPPGPPPPGGWPVVVAIHGGGWRKFSKEQYEPTVAPLARLGFVVAVPNYRLSRPAAPSWPINFAEVRDAVRWVRGHAGAIGADPGRIAAMGESAGGHLAAMLGTDLEASTTSARVQAVVDFYGPSDLAALVASSRAAAGPIRQFLGATPAQAPALYAAASPVAHVSPGDPPFLIVQGSADTVVTPSQSRELSARLTWAGVWNRLVIVPGAAHGFGLRRGLLGEVAAFLKGAMTSVHQSAVARSDD